MQVCSPMHDLEAEYPDMAEKLRDESRGGSLAKHAISEGTKSVTSTLCQSY